MIKCKHSEKLSLTVLYMLAFISSQNLDFAPPDDATKRSGRPAEPCSASNLRRTEKATPSKIDRWSSLRPCLLVRPKNWALEFGAFENLSPLRYGKKNKEFDPALACIAVSSTSA